MLSAPAQARLDALLAVARRLAEAEDPLGQEARARLCETSPLSPEGVDLILREALETEASLEDRAGLAAQVIEAARAHVVLSAHVPTAALRAIALASLGSAHVRVKPSRRDPVLAELLVRELAGSAWASLELEAELEVAEGEVVFAYGADATLKEIQHALPPGVRFRAHGSGLGVALIEPGDDLGAAARALARDVVPFDQAGCLSPRLAFVLGAPGRASAFAGALSVALSELALRIPRGRLDVALATELAQFREVARATGELVEGRDHSLAVDEQPTSLLVPPAARALSVLAARDVSRASDLLAPLAPLVTTVGTLRGSSAPRLIGRDDARWAELGRMQRPRLDGPVDLRRQRD